MSAPHTTGVAALTAEEFHGFIEARGTRPAPTPRPASPPGSPRRVSPPTGIASDTTPTIRATVVDLQGLPEKPDLEVSVDNGPRDFSYNANSGALSLPGGRMAEGHHSVEITAAGPSDPQAPATTKR